MKIIAPSMLSSDFGRLIDEIELVNKSKADLFHLDVMDGVFVPNITFGSPVLDIFKKYAKKPLDIHLMIVNPENYIDKFSRYNPAIITIHLEAVKEVELVLKKIKNLNIKAGVAINPDTPIKHLERNKEFPKPTDNSSPKPNKFNCLESNNPTTKAKMIGGPANLISVHPLELRLPINQVKAA